MKKAFTITELLVAVGLLAVVITVSSIIFDFSIDAQRTAAATSEVMRNLRAITDQLNTDFSGLRKDMPIFYKITNSNNTHADSIVFFTAGDFQTTIIHDGNEPTRGNIARIYYGPSQTPDPLGAKTDPDQKILARKQIILAPDANNSIGQNEYDPNSFFEEMKYCFTNKSSANSTWLSSLSVDTKNEDEIPVFLAKGVDDFTIMFDEDTEGPGRIDWWPKDGEPSDPCDYDKNWPDLIKFSFTLYDSKGIFKNGRHFEHIVYTGN